MDMGATILFVSDNGAQIDNVASSWTVGATVGNAGMSGPYAGNLSLGAGYTKGKVGAKAAPFFQGYGMIAAPPEAAVNKPLKTGAKEQKFNKTVPAEQSVLPKK
jgi:hypothetical protein